jgi:DNA-binding Lrp family transcriptional regulator
MSPVDDTAGAARRLTDKQRASLEGLRRLGLAHPAELSAEVLIQPDEVRREIRKLVAEGLVVDFPTEERVALSYNGRRVAEELRHTAAGSG